MKKWILSVLPVLTGVSVLVAAPQPEWKNEGDVTDPVIDAVNFLNLGSVSVGSLLPFETSDTLNYTNFGTMIGALGWRFEYNPLDTAGVRGMAATFANEGTGLISSLDVGNSAVSPSGTLPLATVYPSYFLVSATNTINRGAIRVGVNSLASFTGRRVDLAHGTVEVLPDWATTITGTIFNPPDHFIPDVGFYDDYWVQADFSPTAPLNFGVLWDGTSANAPGVGRPPSQPTATPPFSLQSPFADSDITGDLMTVVLTNYVGDPTNVTATYPVFLPGMPSNIVKQAVFVGPPSGANWQSYFGGQTFGPNPPNPPTGYKGVGAVLVASIPNTLSGQNDPAYLYVEDDLALNPLKRGLSLNDLTYNTYRPENYVVWRSPSAIGGAGNHGYPEPDFFTSSGSIVLDPDDVIVDRTTNTVVTAGSYAGYGMFVDNLASRPQTVPGSSVTNHPGRIEIRGDNVDLTDTRLRGEGLIKISTPHLISSDYTVVDCEDLNLALGSTNGHFRLKSIVPDYVIRMRGHVYVWSAMWESSATVVFTNNYGFSNYVAGTNITITINPDGSSTTNSTEIYQTNAFPVNLTNTIPMRNHVLMVDARSVDFLLPVHVHEFSVSSASATIDDNINVVESFKLDGKTLTINGNVVFAGVYPPDPYTGLTAPITPLANWGRSNAPSLLYFTNNGSLSIASQAHFGDDRPPYASLVNTGTISAIGIQFNSDYFENGGSFVTAGPLTMRGKSGKLENGNSSSGTTTEFYCNNVKLKNYSLTATGKLTFNVTNSLADSGAGSGNTLTLLGGATLAIKPQTGDLLGTTINSYSPSSISPLVVHTWGAEDRGANASGFYDNAAIGRLVLIPQNVTPEFNFRGLPGQSNALYVDQLDLSGLTNFLTRLTINGNLTIYYASAKLPSGFSLPYSGGRTNTPEEYLDGHVFTGGGRTRWVQDFAGPNSSTVVNGLTVNRALASSQFIDSNSNGIPNYIDLTGSGPFNTSTLTVVKYGQGTVSPDYSGQTLIIGQTYAMRATASDGFTFTGWTGGSASGSRVLFTMQSNLVLSANFSYTATAGSYNGLFYQEPLTNYSQWQYSGSFTLKTTASRTYSGNLQMGKDRYPFSGLLGSDGAATNSLQRKDGTILKVRFQVGNDQVTGVVSDQLESWMANIVADRAAFGKGVTAPYAGNYTLIIPGVSDTSDAYHPQGDGYGSVKVDKSGKIKFSGSIADGTKVSQSSMVSQSGQWPFYLSLYSGQGQILGWLSLEKKAEEDVGGAVSWVKLPNVKAKFYPDGFDINAQVTGSAYDSTLVPVTIFTNGFVVLSGGNLGTSITNGVTIDSKNRVTSTGTNKFSLKLTKPSGLFKGSLKDAAAGTIKFNGVILQKQGFGSGYHLDTNQSGNVLFEP